MMILRGKVPNIPFSSSPGAFVKHLTIINSKPFYPRKIAAKSLRTTAANTDSTVRIRNSSSYFETLNSRQKEQIRLYVDTLLDWNQRMNLTAVTDFDEVMKRHVDDSLAILPHIRDTYASHCDGSIDNLTLVDVGTGAGLPGLILAIACPGWKVTLLESMKKRCMFLENAIGVAGLSNTEVVRGRAEDLGQNALYREKFDVAVARAVAEMRILAEYCLPLVRVGGLFVAAKGHDPQVHCICEQEEVQNAKRSIQLMGASLLGLCSVESHSPHGQRTAIICAKDSPTPRKYPRDPGTPAKLPL
ncbi:hypothetical protein Tsubulata_034421 [Turnera subulata]|uniref:Ribosomal RNA small subunit methyltransferase G n=1 Tax=Turnera subulata TaxID=218843 RepID=A0A9Q0GHS7_9ROSI|nr:hypothetical protein Tsubulata_034421 [Turnera subulata]